MVTTVEEMNTNRPEETSTGKCDEILSTTLAIATPFARKFGMRTKCNLNFTIKCTRLVGYR